MIDLHGDAPPMHEPGDPGWTESDLSTPEFRDAAFSRGSDMAVRYDPATGGFRTDREPPEPYVLANLAAWAEAKAVPKPFLLAGRIPRQEITLLTGDGGANKSTFGQQLATCRAAGLQLLGIPTEPGKSLYITAEDDFDRLQWIHEHICAAIGVDGATLVASLNMASVRGEVSNVLATFDNEGRVRPAPAFARLKVTLLATGADFLVLDNVAHMFAGNENDRGQVTAFVNLLYSLCRDLGVTILLIAHRNKQGDSYSGSTAWLNAVRSQLVLERGDEGDPDARTLTVGKANYARPDEVVRFHWHDFALVREDDMPSDRRAEMDAVIRANGERAAFLRCLTKATADRRAVSHHKGTNYYAKIFADMPEGKGHKAKAFERAFERLLHLGEIRLDQELWRGPNRLLKHGIAVASDCTDPPAQTPRTNLHRPPAETGGKPCTDPHALTPPSTTYIPGAASQPAAPDDDLDWGNDDEGREA